jgi:ATP/maltotriose-dependent transcriptional regulator MalT
VQVAGLSHAELAFNPREAQACMPKTITSTSEEAAKELIEQTSGWITGMVLSNSPGMTRTSGVDTFAYLGRQVPDQQPEPVREFLMRTSCLRIQHGILRVCP